MSPELIIPDVNEEEYEKAGSKFAAEGAHLSECGMPDWDTPGVSIKFPFTIVEKGDDKGKESKMSAGVGKSALWKLKEMLTALGVSIKVGEKGQVSFDPLECVGKKFLSVWTTEIDSRPASEGGKGGSYTKPTAALPVGAKTETLGI